MRPRQALLSVSMALAVAALGGAALAQETPSDQHPIVGTWTVVPVDEMSDAEGAATEPEVLQFGADGTVSDLSALGSGVGSWTSDGDSAVTVTVLFPQTDLNGGFAGLRTVRGAIELGADGGSFAGDVTIELSSPAGTTGQLGPRAVQGTRVTVEEPVEEAAPTVEPLVAQPRRSTDCAGGPVLVEGSRSEFRLTGDCPSVTVNGNGIDVVAQDIGELEIRGTSNEVIVARADSVLISGRGNEVKARELGQVTILGNSNDVDVRGPIDGLVIDGSRNDVDARSLGSVVSNGRFNDIERRR